MAEDPNYNLRDEIFRRIEREAATVTRANADTAAMFNALAADDPNRDFAAQLLMRLRQQAMEIAAKLPRDRATAFATLDYAKVLVTQVYDLSDLKDAPDQREAA